MADNLEAEAEVRGPVQESSKGEVHIQYKSYSGGVGSTGAATVREEEAIVEEVDSKDVLRETLTSYITDESRVDSIVNYELRKPEEMDPGTIFKVLVGTMNYMWFDLFVALGMSHQKMDRIRQKYPCDPNVSLFEAIVEWLNGEEPCPSWKALADVLRFKMLKSKLADEIESVHLSRTETLAADECRKGNIAPVSEDNPSQEGDGSLEFSKLIMEMTDLIGPEFFAEFYYYLMELRCADGTKYIDESYFKDHISPDGIFIALMYNNLIVSKDLDVLTTVVQDLDRDDMLRLIEDYNSKLTVGRPFLQAVQDPEHFFALHLELDSDVTDLDIEGVDLVKDNICKVLGVTELKYLLQFFGWKKDPVVLRFQVHISLVDRVVEAVDNDSVSLEHYVRLEMDVRDSIFNYDLMKIKKR